jgi:PhnB protein
MIPEKGISLYQDSLSPDSLKTDQEEAMSVTPNYVPRSYKTINPMLVLKDVRKALRFYNNAFGAEIISEFTDPAGHIVYAEMKIDDAVIILTEEDTRYQQSAQALGDCGMILQIYTGDAEALFEAALMAGCREVFPVKEHFYGDRGGRVKDPFGFQWIIATHIEDVPPNELKRRFDNLYS